MDQVNFNQTISSLYETELILLCVSTVIVVIGVLGNSLTIGLIVCEKKFHTPTYVAIACLSFSDMTALTFSYLFKCVYPFSMVSFVVLSGISISCLHVSTCHVVLFAILRYLIVAHPLWSRRHVRIKAVLITSLFLWMYGVTYGVFHLMVLEKSSSRSVTIAVDRTLEIIVPLAFILVFHCLKIRHLKRSETPLISRQANRMFKVTSVIACAYFVTMTPIWTVVILIALDTFGEEPPGYMSIIFTISVLIYLLNFVIDPFIYFVFTPKFRKQILIRCKCFKRDTSNNDGQHSAYTSMLQLHHNSQNSQLKNVEEHSIIESQM